MRRFHGKIVAGMAIVLLLTLSACTKSKNNPESRPTAMASEVATKIEAAMAADKTAQAAVVAPELRESYLQQSGGGSLQVKIDRQTFRSVEDYGRVEADVSGQGRQLLHLLRKNGEWLIFHTESLVASSTSATQSLKRVAFQYAKDADCGSGFGKRHPVIFVHGLNASGKMWQTGEVESLFAKVKTLASLEVVEPFDYGSWSSQWIDHPEIGPKLAKRIACLANESRKAGGLGKVIVVAHSMGGLATRFAADQTDEFTGKKVADVLGLVVTIATPNNGSPLADINAAYLRKSCENKDPDCQEKQSAVFAMQQFGREGKIDKLPALPEQVPLLGLAGDVHLNFTIFAVSIPVSGSDLVVPVKSAAIGSSDEKRGGGVKIIPCKAVIPIAGYTKATCEHGNLVKDAKVKEYAVAGITKYLSSLRGPVIKFHGMTLPLPAGWKVISQKPDEWRIQDNCPGGTCKTLTLLGPNELYTETCGELLENRVFKMGTRPAKYMRSQCISGISHTWVTTNEPPVAAVSWDPPAGLEELLSNVTWS